MVNSYLLFVNQFISFFKSFVRYAAPLKVRNPRFVDLSLDQPISHFYTYSTNANSITRVTLHYQYNRKQVAQLTQLGLQL